jgi:rhodanese-related sulfurtransferase
MATRAHDHPSPAVAVLCCAILAATAGCRWREGRSVLIPDTGPDASDADAETLDGAVDADAECGDAGPEWIDPISLFMEIDVGAEGLVIFDVRPLEYCETARVPGAECNPWDGADFAAPIVVADEPGRLVLYDARGELVAGAAESLPRYCARVVTALEGGFAAWAENEELPIDDGPP